MNEDVTAAPVFDFSAFSPARQEARELIRAFCASPGFRSAVVEELELDEDFYRRPLRPEDLEILPFEQPVSETTVSQLPALATQRMLLSIHELGVSRLPPAGDKGRWAACAEFYSDRNQVLGARIRPFLENYAFDFLARDLPLARDVEPLVAAFGAVQSSEFEFWTGLSAQLRRDGYSREGVRLALIQRWSLLPAQRAVLGRAAASGHLELLAEGERPSLAAGTAEEVLQQLGKELGVANRAHSFWQFYLATSLARCNLLHALAARPNRAAELLGAAFVAEADWLAFRNVMETLARDDFGLAAASRRARGSTPVEAQQAELAARFTRAAALLGQRDRRLFSGFAHGVALAQRLAERARWDLGEQLSWLGVVELYTKLAQRISVRIEAECPNIDRDTFVEPREMCSTTHVHNDHRLVVIESGKMVFWGNLGMQLKMDVGDKVLIPAGRLHGSTVTSEECVYHQPIIPDEWVRPLMRDLRGGPDRDAQAPA